MIGDPVVAWQPERNLGDMQMGGWEPLLDGLPQDELAIPLF